MTSVIRLNEAVDQDAMRKARALFAEIDDRRLFDANAYCKKEFSEAP